MLNENQVKALIERFKIAKKRRQLWEPTWRECFDYTMPGRQGFATRSAGTRGDDLIFDETAVVGAPEFASRMVQGMTPDNVRWSRLEVAPAILKGLDEEKAAKAQGELDEVTEYVFEIIQNSNYQQEAHECFLDIGVGTGNMLIDEGDLLEPIRFNAVPMHEVYLEEGPFGRVEGRFRCRKVAHRNIKTIWPNATLSEKLKKEIEEKPEKEITFIEATVRDRSDDTQEAYDHVVIHEKNKEAIHEDRWTGTGSCPWVNPRWSKAAGEVWGRGPIYNALAAIKTANLTVQLILENAEMSIAGMWQADDDGVVNPHNINLVPGTIIPRAVGSTGLTPLASPGDFDVAELVLRDQRHNINKALYNETLGRREGTPMSATETAERMAELSRVLGSPFGRMKMEYTDPIVKRVIYILKKQGRIELPTIDGREIKIRAVSPMVRAQRNEDITQHVNFAQVSSEILGPQVFQANVDGDKFMARLGEWYEIGSDLFFTPDEKKKNAAEAGEIAGQAAAQGMDIGGDNIRSLLP